MGSGGSAFMDGGLGAMYALGVMDLIMKDGSKLGKDEIPFIETALNIEKVVVNREAPILKDVEFILPCDVTTALLGPVGAAYVFGP